MRARTERLLRWFLFSVLVSLVPLALTYLNLLLDGREAHLEMLLARGELLLVSATLGAAALGELFPGGRENAMGKLLASGASVLMIVLSSVCFASIQSRQSPNPGPIFVVSLFLFAGMLLAAGSCMFYSQQEEG
jgi:hypothetical protein